MIKIVNLTDLQAVLFNDLLCFATKYFIFIYFTKPLALRVTIMHNDLTEAKGATEKQNRVIKMTTVKSLAKDTNRKSRLDMVAVEKYAEMVDVGLITYSEALGFLSPKNKFYCEKTGAAL